MAGKENLVPFQDFTAEKQREIARMGGIASGEAKKRRKTFREMVEVISSMGVPDKMLKKLREQGVTKEDATYQAAIVMKMFHEAMSGNVAAFNAIVNVSGEIVNKHELSGKNGEPLQVENQLSLSEIRERLKDLDSE